MRTIDKQALISWLESRLADYRGRAFGNEHIDIRAAEVASILEAIEKDIPENVTWIDVFGLQ